MRSPTLSITILASLLACLVAPSQNPTNDFDPLGEIQHNLPRMIRVHVEFIEMPHPTYTSLMAAPRTATNDTDLRATCADLLASGEARMLESLSVTALPGQNATSESIAEYIYPTEAEPPLLPNKIASGSPPSTFPAPPVGTPPVPSAFDTKNTGATLEIEAQIDFDSPVVELRLTPTIVYLADQINWGTWENGEVTVETTMPLFYVLSTKTGANLVSGQPQMLAAHSPKNDQGYTDYSRKVMLFVRADIIHSGK